MVARTSEGRLLRVQFARIPGAIHIVPVSHRQLVRITGSQGTTKWDAHVRVGHGPAPCGCADHSAVTLSPVQARSGRSSSDVPAGSATGVAGPVSGRAGTARDLSVSTPAGPVGRDRRNTTHQGVVISEDENRNPIMARAVESGTGLVDVRPRSVDGLGRDQLGRDQLGRVDRAAGDDASAEPVDEPSASEIRDWARQRGIWMDNRGRIPTLVRQMFLDAAPRDGVGLGAGRRR